MIYESPCAFLPDPPPFNSHNIFFNRPGAEEPPNHVVFIDAVTGKQQMRDEFIRNVHDGATALGADVKLGGLGLGGDGGNTKETVGIYADNSSEYVNLVHSLLKVAQPFALISAHCTPFELTHCIKKARVTSIFVQPSFLSKVVKVSKECGLASNKIYIVDGNVSGKLSFSQMIDGVRKKKMERVPARNVTKDTLAYLVFSSGTSGLPKAVMISHMNLNYSIMQAGYLAMELMKFMPRPAGEDVRVLAFLPMYHSFGLHVYAFRSLLSPQTMVLMPRWNIQQALKFIPKYKVTALALVPSIVHQLVSSKKFMDPSFDTSSLNSAGSGAAHLPPHLAEKLKTRLQLPTMGSGYGLSEVTIAAMFSGITGFLDGKVVASPNATGILFPGMVARLVLPNGEDAPRGGIGELWLKGTNVAMGYYNDPKATSESFVTKEDGLWLRTGDRFRVDENNNFFFEDRSKDTLKVSGLQVSPKEIEEFILLSESTKTLVADVAVAGVITTESSRTEDEKVPRAWIVLSRDGKKLGEAEAKKRVAKAVEDGLSKYKWLRGGVQVVDEIPKNPTGKMLKRVLVAEYDKKHGANASAKAKL